VTEIQAPSSAAECARLRKIIRRLASDALHSPCAASDIELAFGEAFSNAVKYGDKDGRVRVRIAYAGSREIAVEMEYPGRRFDTTVTHPSKPQTATGGFGRFIMRQLLDSMDYSFRNGHTTLRMTKRR
jgi:anti-sigma regulatory factor (Ser/Thr protein kinase)